jgi:asparagine synthase (glutamine-hydrolysing)
MVWRSGEQRIERYWTPDDERVDVPSHPEEAAAELRRLLENAVRIRLRSDVPVGAFLSGGLDSSLIVALASRQAEIPLQTFTVTFAEQDYDEAPFAALVAEHCGTEHRAIPVADLDLGILPELVRQYDEPFADPSAVPTFYVTREASRYVKVCLSGDGGDELFGGYRRYRWEPLERTVGRLPRRARQAVLGPLGRRLPHSTPGKGWLERMAVSGAQRLQRKVGIFDPAERRALLRPEFRQYVRDDAWFIQQHYAGGRCELSRRMVADRGTYLPEDVLTKVDRASMANSLEVRVPLLDHRIVAFADRLAFELKIRGGEQKYLLKCVLRDLVPREILSRDKRGFGMPLKHWFADGRLDESLAMLTSSQSRSGEFLDRSEIQSLVRAHGSGRRDLSGRLWALIWLEHWCREAG